MKTDSLDGKPTFVIPCFHKGQRIYRFFPHNVDVAMAFKEMKDYLKGCSEQKGFVPAWVMTKEERKW